MVRTEYDYVVFPRHFKKVQTIIVIDINTKLQESKDERRTRLDENKMYRE